MNASSTGVNEASIGVAVAGRLAQPASKNLVTAEERAFVRKMVSLPYVSQIGLDSLIRLKDAFKVATTEDPYSLSPTYYGLTGRRGLWLHECEEADTAMIFCLHPNKEDTILIFPPFGMNPANMLINFLETIAPLGMQIQIGRVYKEDTNILKFACAARGLTAIEASENTLDWAYPVHTIATDDILKREGPRYQRLRTAYRKLEQRMGATVENIDFRNDQRLLEKLAHDWARNNPKHFENYDKDIPSDYFMRLIRIAQNEDIVLYGKIVLLNGIAQGFSIWEPPYSRSRAANLYASQVSNFGVTNLGTYLTMKTAEAIAEQGGHFMCLGGSEDEDMDNFKRGFRPHKSKELKTIWVMPERSIPS